MSDDREMVVVREEDYKWADEEWVPRVIKAGFKYWAIVLPSSSIGTMQVKRFAEEHRARGVTVEVFDTLESAMEWLESK